MNALPVSRSKVLVVDDEKSIRISLRELLKDADYDVAVAEDADQATELLLAEDFDVVLADIILPRVTGMSLLTAIREASPYVQVILMTGEPTVETASEAVRAGAFDYLAKPIGKEQFLKTVANAAKVKALDAERRRLAEENRMYQDTLEHLVEERTNKLHKSMEQYRILVDTSPYSIHQIDRQGRFISVNKAGLEMFGLARESDIAGLRYLDSVSDDDRARVDQLMQAAFDGRSQEFECKGVKEKVYQSIFVPLRDEAGNVMNLMGISLDITERKRAEEILREMAAFAETNPAPVLKLDRQGAIQLLNPAARRLFADEDLMMGKSWFALCPELDRGIFGQLIEKPGEMRHEMRIGDKWFQFTYKGSTETGFIYVYGADVTELKQTEAQLRQVQKMDAIGQLAGGIAHDFNNILTAIFGYSHLLQQALPAQPDLHGHLEQVLIAAERAKGLVKQILTFSRQSEVQRQPLALQIVVTEVLSLLRAALPSTIQIRTTIDPAGGMIMADPTELHQVIMNLCTNAEHAMRKHGGVLEIRLCDVTLDASRASLHGVPEGRYAQLHIRDTGSGMLPEVSERIFEPFFTTKPVGEGSGMGLSVVHGIVKRNEGAITVESVVGQGTTFVLLFPVVASRWKKAMVSSTSEPLHGTEHILFVDDEPLLVSMYERMVQAYGYVVTTRTSSIEALALFRECPNRFDIVVTDQTMPQLTGAKLAQEILRIRPDVPIILCTGFSATVSSDMAASLGIRDYVMKPIIVPDLLRRIRKIFDNNSHSLP